MERFNEDRCFTAAIVISYFSLLCLVPLIALFAFLGAKILGNPELIFRSLNIFTDEFLLRWIQPFLRNSRPWAVACLIWAGSGLSAL